MYDAVHKIIYNNYDYSYTCDNFSFQLSISIILKRSTITTVRNVADIIQTGIIPKKNALSGAAIQKIGTTFRLYPPTAN